MTRADGAGRRRIVAAPALAALLAAVPWRGAVAQEAAPACLQRRLGRSGRALPAIGLGTWLTFDVGDDAQEREQRREVMRRFFAAGGGMIDSSPMYGSAERVVGDLLPGLPHEGRLVAATKVWTPLTGLGPGQLERSLKDWRRDRFDVLLVHNLLNWQAHLKLLRRAKEDGRAAHIGISTSHGNRHDDVERILKTEPIDVLQITYNLADQRAEPLLALAAERGVGVVVNRPFDGGRLFGAVGRRAPPAWAAEAGCATWPAFFLKWIVSHPAVSCAIPATRLPAHLDENMAAGLGALPDPATRKRMQALVAALWSRSSAAAAFADPPWRDQELLLMSEVMRLVGRSLAPEIVLREMLHLLSELLGLNRGRIVLADGVDIGEPAKKPARRAEAGPSSIRIAYGLTRAEMARGRYAAGEGITGAVLATGHAIIVQDIDAEPRFLARAVERARLPQETVAFIALPIEVDRRTVGVLGAHRIRRRSRLLDDDVAVLKILATLAGQVLQLRALVDEKTAALEARNAQLERALDSASARYGIIGRSPPLLRALGELERVSQASASVLLLGASGTGKELFARAVHLASPRRDAPFIKVNCAAIPESLFESELFGHERGAFTGAAAARAGWFEQADGGTIFLDEIGELPLPMQAKLLRTLQEGTIARLGGKREAKVDVRLVAATNRDLGAEAERGAFRRDLFYRLNVVPIRLPTLAERHEDIRPLALHMLNRVNQANQRNVNLSQGALDALEACAWPGNIRELANVVERLVLLTDDATVSAAEIARFLPVPGGSTSTATVAATPTAPPAPASLVREYRALRSHSAEELREALVRHGGNRSRAAQSLGLTARQFMYRLQKLG